MSYTPAVAAILVPDLDVVLPVADIDEGRVLMRRDGVIVGTTALRCVSQYVSGVGTSGTPGTAMTVITRPVFADTLSSVGDRLHIRAYFATNSASPIVATLAVGPSGSEVAIASGTHFGGTTWGMLDCDLQYIDATHANVMEHTDGELGPITAANVAGFAWDAAQQAIVTQGSQGTNFVTVYAVFVDLIPLPVP